MKWLIVFCYLEYPGIHQTFFIDGTTKEELAKKQAWDMVRPLEDQILKRTPEEYLSMHIERSHLMDVFKTDKIMRDNRKWNLPEDLRLKLMSLGSAVSDINAMATKIGIWVEQFGYKVVEWQLVESNKFYTLTLKTSRAKDYDITEFYINDIGSAKFCGKDFHNKTELSKLWTRHYEAPLKASE